MSINKYEPSSHFFVDHTNLSDPLSANIASDTYGPVDGNETSKYRTTSFVRASSNSKVFAICDGHILIQPCDGDSTKVNLILKPTASYSPFKIKYFIYRGVDIDDLIVGFDVAQQTADSPEFIKRVWKASNDLAEALGEPLPSNLDAKFIGYDPNLSDDELLSYVFLGGGTVDFNLYNIPKCFKGELIGNFTNKIGLDIVLDYGDYELDYEEQLFKLDLGYARKPEHVFDVSTITGAVKQKRYREYIHRFIDAAAFWGSHIECGEVFLHNVSSPQKTVSEIYPVLINKYQTANKLYLYIQAERERSLNFYNNYPTDTVSFELQGDSLNYVPYITENVWPILIKTFTQTTITGVSIGIKNPNNPNLINIDKKKASYIRVSNLETENLRQYSSSITGFNCKIEVTDNGTDELSIANMIYVNHLGDENLLYPYFNNLFGLVNIKSPIEGVIGGSEPEDYGQSINNINPQTLTTFPINRFRNAVINTKLITDIGKNELSATKRRKLYISETVNLHSADSEYIINSPTYSFDKNIKDNYQVKLYDDPNFEIYKGELDDSGVINTLTLVNTKNHLLKQSYFQLGILEEEYNKLIYDSLTVPDPLPSPPHIPIGISKIFFHLEEISISSSLDFRKFKLGLKYENTSGNIEIRYPSSANTIYIYTIDGFFFFSPGYSEFQDIYKTFAKVSAHFRPITNWIGEYGFDWIRVKDSGLDGDNTNSRKYFNILGHYYDNSNPRKKTPKGPQNNDTFLKEKVEWQALHRIYPSYAKLLTNYNLLDTYSQYGGSYLSLYPSLSANGNPTSFPKQTSNQVDKCLTERFLNLKIYIDSSPSSLKIRFETDHFDINSIPLSDTTVIPDTTDPQRYSCLEINDKSTGTNNIELRIKALKEFKRDNKIQVLATENGNENLAGEMLAKANAKSLRKETKVLFVNVITDIDNNGTQEQGIDFVNSTIGEEMEDLITPFFNQGIIDIVDIAKLGAQISGDDLSLDVRPSKTTIFNAKYVDSSGNFRYEKVNSSINTDLSGNPINNSAEDNIHYDLKKFLFAQHPSHASLYKDYLIVFYLGVDDSTPVSGGGTSYINGVGLYNRGLTIVMKNGIGTSGNLRKTTAHELLHAVGLLHTFDSRNEYTFKQFITDNIMDYYDVNYSPPERVSFSQYQREIISKNSFITDEK